MKPGDMAMVTDSCPSVDVRGEYGTVTADKPGVDGCVIVDFRHPFGLRQINLSYLRPAIREE